MMDQSNDVHMRELRPVKVLGAIDPRVAYNGFELPAIGFGTAGLVGNAGVDVIMGALEVGYRLIDSAFMYENEGIVGKAVRQSSVPRQEIIVTSKLPGRHHSYAEARVAIEESVARTGLDYIDLYLIHWPNPSQGSFVQAWQALIDAREAGLVRHIGVSNFLPGHIERLYRATAVMPEVNQIERHPYFQRHEEMEYDNDHGIITQAWCPLGRANEMLKDPDIVAIARKYGVKVGQVVLRWHEQTGDVAIPKASSEDHQRMNLNVDGFTLDEGDMAALSSLDNPQGSCWGFDSRFHEEF